MLSDAVLVRELHSENKFSRREFCEKIKMSSCISVSVNLLSCVPTRALFVVVLSLSFKRSFCPDSKATHCYAVVQLLSIVLHNECASLISLSYSIFQSNNRANTCPVSENILFGKGNLN